MERCEGILSDIKRSDFYECIKRPFRFLSRRSCRFPFFCFSVNCKGPNTYLEGIVEVKIVV